ncbi:hypothetical protein WG66_000532 [Moniliophthora roreri]|nr:hypothetical protein WG66_000532 [Moniliophthora roreri]
MAPPSRFVPSPDDASDGDGSQSALSTLFIDPMLGSPLQIYIEKDVQNRESLVGLVTKHGGTISPGYSHVPYILVDPLKPSGQSLYRQYAAKRGKIVLNAQWVEECIKAGQLQTFHTNWAGCKVTGNETASPTPAEILSVPEQQQPQQQAIPSAAPAPAPPPPHPIITPQTVEQLVHHAAQAHQFPYPIFPSHLHPGSLPREGSGPLPPPPPPPWQTQPSIAPQQTHISPPHPHPPPPPPTLLHPTTTTTSPALQSVAGPSTAPVQQQAPAKVTRGRKRTRTVPPPAAPPSSLVINRNPPARSPTPPTRVIKSTYGGNLFTADDIEYLKKYIDYSQEQGLVLSLREICERIAIKAPHHSFYSWRRYCNKHRIKLGGYAMNADRSESPPPDGVPGEPDIEEEEVHVALPGSGLGSLDTTARQRNRSPTPPRVLHRSTTGKGVAFTDEDIKFLIRFMEYRKSQGKLDMVAFWKDVAAKAPHHSRASWMKYWRRHKHELDRTDTDDPLPSRPDKKMRYSREDDVLLAKFFCNQPEGTSDKVFQAFGRQNPHHPWKGWQEHHRIHKAKIDHYIKMLKNGENIDDLQDDIEPPSYLLVPGFLDSVDTNALLSRAKQLLDEFPIENHPLTKFTTGDDNHVGDDYFLTSGDKIRFFLEEDAIDKDGKLTREKQKAVNKIGHGLHELDPLFRKVTLENERLKALVRDLKFHVDPVALQSMVITKQPEIGGAVPEHNDSTFLYTDPPSALGFWIALEQCTPENGALSFLPGSHRTAPITKRFVRLPSGGTGFESLSTPELEAQYAAASQGKYILETCNPGDLVLIHGSVLHKSERNTSQHARFAYTFHMIESPPRATYDAKNWLQPTPGMPFSHILDKPNMALVNPALA